MTNVPTLRRERTSSAPRSTAKRHAELQDLLDDVVYHFNELRRAARHLRECSPQIRNTAVGVGVTNTTSRRRKRAPGSRQQAPFLIRPLYSRD